MATRLNGDALRWLDALDREGSLAQAGDRLLLQLTYWQGKTYEEAAALLSWPIGTVRSRLSRVRERLRGRLARLGLAPVLAVAGPASAVGGARAAHPPEALVLQTVRAATRLAGGMTAAVEAGAVPASVAAMVNGELSMMATLSWKSIAALLLVGGTVTAGVGAMAVRGAGAGRPSVPAVVPEPAPPAARPAPPARDDDRSILTNAGVEDGEGDSPRAWTSGATIPGVEYLWSREGHTGKASLCLKKTGSSGSTVREFDTDASRGVLTRR